MADGEKGEGEKAEGEKAEGENADGEKAEGEKAEGENADGEKAEGEKAEGENADGENADGENAEGEKAEGALWAPPSSALSSRRSWSEDTDDSWAPMSLNTNRSSFAARPSRSSVILLSGATSKRYQRACPS